MFIGVISCIREHFSDGKMSKLLILTLSLFNVAFSAKLDQTYLPPLSASSAGGNGNFLAAPTSPNHGSFFPSTNHKNVAILRYNVDQSRDGSYHFEYETQNKISQHESGQLKNIGTDQEANVVTGSYSYTGPDGVIYTVDYVADENGFRASGVHLPTPPPVPEAILKSLQTNNGANVQQTYQSRNNGGYNY